MEFLHFHWCWCRIQTIEFSVVNVDSTTGVVSLAQLLDFEKRQRYEVTLVAADDSQLSGESKLVVTVGFQFGSLLCFLFAVLR